MKIAIKLILIVVCLVILGGLYFKEKITDERYQSLKMLVSCKLLSKADVRVCLSHKFENLGYTQGGVYSMATLLDLQSYDKSLGGCHDLAHYIGRGVYRKNPGDISLIVDMGSTECSAGQVHGMLESYFNSRDVALDGSLNSLCGVDKDSYCSHVIGHYLLVWTNKDIDKSVTICKSFKRTDQTYFCQTGLFMEYMTGQNLFPHGLISSSWFDDEADLENVINLCQKHTGMSFIACWDMLPHAILPKLGNNIEKAYDYCNLTPNLVASERCRNLTLGLITGKNNDIGDDFLLSIKN